MTSDAMPTDEDVVVHVRQWGTDSITPLSGFEPVDLAPGVRLERQAEHWWICADADHAVQVDGIYQRECQLRPATEIVISATLYIAETQRLVRVRDACRRLYGWQPDQLAEADGAMRKVWLCMTRRAAIVIRVEKDILPAARLLHRAIRGDSAPFILCSRAGHAEYLPERIAEKTLSTTEAVLAASGGSLCIRTHDRPKDHEALTREAFRPNSRITLFLCATPRSWQYETLSEISPPPHRIRIADRTRIVTEYAKDALRRLNAPAECFRREELEHVLTRYSYSLDAIEQAVERLVRLNMSTNPRETARQLRVNEEHYREWMKEIP